ncbi:hypothetical protein M9H77_02241 [Catharanthus roseus]|uniref:Uncharacterized protein n=1 Tax=Catharanthus roseus TaxID=4058 RepID=A0ACC0C884_CATRO|nr:hypothetical protein M9H77_02241 [Catharanthus roseus]
MNKVIEDNLVDIQCMIINGHMVTFLLMLDPMSLIPMISMRAIDLELKIVIMVYQVIEDTLADIQYMIINGDMVTFLLMPDLMNLIPMIAMRAIDLELEIVIMVYQGYGNFSPHARPYELNSYDCYERNRLGARDCYKGISCKGVPRNDFINRENYVNMDERFHKEKLITRDIVKVITIEEGEWNPINQDLSLMKQSLRNKFGVGNYERQRQGQAKGKFMESSMGEMSTKAKELSQAQDVIDRKSFTMRRRTLVPL